MYETEYSFISDEVVAALVSSDDGESSCCDAPTRSKARPRNAPNPNKVSLSPSLLRCPPQQLLVSVSLLTRAIISFRV